MGWCYVCVSLDFLCRWQVQVSLYCAWWIPAHLRCTQCSILLHLMDICFLTCICLWQISQIQTFLFRVVGPGLVSTSSTFVSNSASHPADPHGRHVQKTVNRAPIAGGGSTQFAQQLESAVTAPPLVGCVVWSHTWGHHPFLPHHPNSHTPPLSSPRSKWYYTRKVICETCTLFCTLLKLFDSLCN